MPGGQAIGSNGRVRGHQTGAGGSGRKTWRQSESRNKLITSTMSARRTGLAEDKRGRSSIIAARQLNKEYVQLRDLVVAHCNGDIILVDFLARSGGRTPEEAVARMAELNVQITKLMDYAMVQRIKGNPERASAKKRMRTKAWTKAKVPGYESEKEKLKDKMKIGDEDNAGRT